MLLYWCLRAGSPLSKAGETSTSLGIIPRLSRLNIPSLMSVSSIGGGSANGSSLKCFGRILFGAKFLAPLTVPIPSFSSSLLLIPPYARPYLNILG